jgi:hypothetical protein
LQSFFPFFNTIRPLTVRNPIGAKLYDGSLCRNDAVRVMSVVSLAARASAAGAGAYYITDVGNLGVGGAAVKGLAVATVGNVAGSNSSGATAGSLTAGSDPYVNGVPDFSF